MQALSHLLLKLLFQKKLIHKSLGLLQCQCSINRSTDSCLQIYEIALSFCSGSTTAQMYTCSNALCFAEMWVSICIVRTVILTEQKFLVICCYSHWMLNLSSYLRGHSQRSPWVFEDCLKVQYIKTQRYMSAG